MNDRTVEYQTLAEHLPHMVWETDENGINHYQSPSWYQYVGDGPPHSFGEAWLKYYHPEDRERLTRAWRESLASAGQVPYDIEVRIRRHDGQYRWFRVQGKPIRDAEGRVERWVGSCTDIDEQKRASLALHRLLPRREPHARAHKSAARPAYGYTLVVLAALVPVVLFALIARQSYHEAETNARERLVRTAQIGLEHATRVIETNKVIAQSLVGYDDAAIARAPLEAARQLTRLATDLPQIQSLWVWNAEGRPLASSIAKIPPGLNVADREYFQALKQGSEDWFVSAPLVSRSTGEKFVDISRRRLDAAGRFAGVISVSVRPDYFATFYRELSRQEPGLTLNLIRADGTIIARYPQRDTDRAKLAPESPILAKLRAGESTGFVVGPSSVDGIVRVAAFAGLAAFPMFVVASIDERSMLASWRANTLRLAAIALPAAVALAWLALVAVRRSRREHLALMRLEREVDQRNRAEEALQHAQKLEAMGLLTGSVAHDFNNLLMIISNSLYLQKRLHPDVEAGPEYAAMTRAVESGTKLTRQLLAFARRQPLAPAHIRLQEFIPSLADLLRTSLGRHAELQIRVPADTPSVFVDPAELELAMLNVVMNARDAMPPGGGRVTIDAARTTNDPASVTISISDTGRGIPPDALQKVFEPFFTTKEPGSGTGLGLSQVHGFCTGAGGRVFITSTLGQGSCVHLQLPATQSGATTDRTGETQQPDSLRGHVLLVEDMPDIAASTAKVLAAAGCTVEIVTNAQDASNLLRARAGDYDLVLSDIRMPGGMSGIDLARQVRQHWPQLPVVLMTGYSSELDSPVAEGIQVLAKPVGASLLIQTLGRFLAAQRPPARLPRPGSASAGGSR